MLLGARDPCSRRLHVDSGRKVPIHANRHPWVSDRQEDNKLITRGLRNQSQKLVLDGVGGLCASQAYEALENAIRDSDLILDVNSCPLGAILQSTISSRFRVVNSDDISEHSSATNHPQLDTRMALAAVLLALLGESHELLILTLKLTLYHTLRICCKRQLGSGVVDDRIPSPNIRPKGARSSDQDQSCNYCR